LKELSVFESVEEYDFEKMFDTAENKLLKDLKTMDPKRINQVKLFFFKLFSDKLLKKLFMDLKKKNSLVQG